jgi:NadR type nicotinamide-nucleotide adenylyltransferase
MEKENGMKKIVVIGPESTGKTTLTKALAKHFKCEYVEEYAREYIEKLDRPYQKIDILTIAKKQIELEEKKKENKAFLFLDTNLIVCKVWSQYKYGSCHSWILEQIKKREYHHYLLCDIDIEWEADSQREHPNNRKELFEIYKKELSDLGKSFSVVSGRKNERLLNAISNLSSTQMD